MGVHGETTDKQEVSIPDDLITPFGLNRHLNPPKMKLDLVPVLDLIVLALLLSLLFSRYLILPGVQIDLPKTELSIQQDASSVVVLTIANSGMLFFAGSVYEQNSIEPAFQKYLRSHRSKSPVLLIKVGASMDMQQFLDLCEMAQAAGFSGVQIAADPKVSQESITETLTLPQPNKNVVFPVQ